jgi:DNA-binding protein H-NS
MDNATEIKSNNIDVSDLDVNELRALRKKVDEALENVEKAKRKEAQDKVRDLAREMGISIEELMSDVIDIPQKRTKTKVAPKFRHPDGSQEWSGRGRTPKWVLEYVGTDKLDRDDEMHDAKLKELTI